MANGWQSMQGFVALSQALRPHADSPTDLVIELPHEISPPPFQPLSDIGGVLCYDVGLRLFDVVDRPFLPEDPNITIVDSAPAPPYGLDVNPHQPHFTATYAQHVWGIAPLYWNALHPELESPAGPRRIWNREVLTPRRCELERCPRKETQGIQPRREEEEDPDLLQGVEAQPDLASLQRLAPESLPSEPAVPSPWVLALIEDASEAPHLILPRVKVEYDLPLPGGLVTFAG